MGEKVSKVIWTPRAIASLEDIYSFYAELSIPAANNIIDEIIEKTEKTNFSEQYQQDDINPKYRRVVVRHWKVLYRISSNKIFVIDVFDARQSDEILKGI